MTHDGGKIIGQIDFTCPTTVAYMIYIDNASVSVPLPPALHFPKFILGTVPLMRIHTFPF